LASETSFWPTYTNVAYANGKLLVPVYPGRDPQGEAVALGLYQDLMPDWTIVPVAAAAFQQLGGGIHCATLNLPSLGKIQHLDQQKRASVRFPLEPWASAQRLMAADKFSSAAHLTNNIPPPTNQSLRSSNGHAICASMDE
jgi:hypothetical protein